MKTQDVNIARATFNSSASTAVSPDTFTRLAATLALWRTRAKERAELANLAEVVRRRGNSGPSSADVWRFLGRMVNRCNARI